MTGSASGDRYGTPRHGRAACAPLLSIFVDDEGGHTSVAFACALLVSLSLVFATATAGWVLSRSADVQEVADACALAGENPVAAYATVAQVLDACVLSMGIAGVVVAGAGLVLAAVPGASAEALEVTNMGRDILDARRDFAHEASEGLSRLEGTLPLLVVANSATVVSANSSDGAAYVGCAIPFPQESLSEFSLGDENPDTEAVDDAAGRMRDASDRAKDAQDRADALQREGWLADCGSTPRCMRERAGTLAGLSGSANPNYPSPEGWNFGVALERARAYYARRVAIEAPHGGDIESVTDSLARRAFYEYARDTVRSGHYRELADGAVDLSLPRLPRNMSQVRATRLYTESRWPCSIEDGVRTLHSTLACPGATGPSSGTASLAEQESGIVGHCPVCRMDVGDMGKTPAASTSIDNGFEHFWARVCDAADDYEAACADLAAAKGEMRSISDEGASAFERAIEALSVDRPSICPPGAWGCVAVVARPSTGVAPAELTSSFLTESHVPAGAAVSAAVLAPDPATAENNVLSSFLDGLSVDGGVAVGVAGRILDAWGSFLVAYGSAYEDVGGTAGGLLTRLDGVSGSSIGRSLSERLAGLVAAAGFEPVDMRMRKPVLTGTANVLGRGGMADSMGIRELVESLPASGSPAQIAAALGRHVVNRFGATTVTIAELPIPGTDLTIPLTLDLRGLVNAV
ncbi:MAG: hypothetical protein IKG69_12095 [Atopobiaceae bacterium]|nr:hypothetical protein [Atopobiaceae bacterium]